MYHKLFLILVLSLRSLQLTLLLHWSQQLLIILHSFTLLNHHAVVLVVSMEDLSRFLFGQLQQFQQMQRLPQVRTSLRMVPWTRTKLDLILWSRVALHCMLVPCVPRIQIWTGVQYLAIDLCCISIITCLWSRWSCWIILRKQHSVFRTIPTSNWRWNYGCWSDYRGVSELPMDSNAASWPYSVSNHIKSSITMFWKLTYSLQRLWESKASQGSLGIHTGGGAMLPIHRYSILLLVATLVGTDWDGHHLILPCFYIWHTILAVL